MEIDTVHIKETRVVAGGHLDTAFIEPVMSALKDNIQSGRRISTSRGCPAGMPVSRRYAARRVSSGSAPLAPSVSGTMQTSFSYRHLKQCMSSGISIVSCPLVVLTPLRQSPVLMIGVGQELHFGISGRVELVMLVHLKVYREILIIMHCGIIHGKCL